MPEIRSNTLLRSARRDWSSLIGSWSSTRLGRIARCLFCAARGRTNRNLARLTQIQRFARDQFQNITATEAPTAPDPISWSHTSFRQLVHRLEMYLQQSRNFRGGHDFFHSCVSPLCKLQGSSLVLLAQHALCQHRNSCC